MSRFLGYQCSLCQREFAHGEVTYICPHDQGNLDVILDYAQLSRTLSPESLFNAAEHSLWRYTPLLPIADPGYRHTPLHFAGWTPIYQPQLLMRQLGASKLWIKDESKNPTASFKDRASAIVLGRAIEIGARVVVTASTGNAGAALAGMAASCDQRAVIFAPRTAPPAKIAQLLIYNAEVYLVDGNYDQAFDLSMQAAQEFGWYCRNTGYNPFTAEGKKTAAFEIWEWFRRFEALPVEDLTIFIPVGDGNIISGIHKGFEDLRQLGWIEKCPTLIGVQAEGSAAIAHAFSQNLPRIQPVKAQTIADSISVDLPRDGWRALRAVRESNGWYITVSDEEILQAISALGAVGIFAEPAGAAAYAGLVKTLESQMVNPDSPVLAMVTGSGLKDVRAAMQAVPEAPIIEPTLQALKRVIK